MTTTPTKPNWFIPTPAKLVALLLIVEICLLLVNRHSGWLCLSAVAAFVLTILIGVVWSLVCLLWRGQGRSSFQFGIGTLLILMGCVAVVGGWFSWKMERAKRQKEAVEAIRDLGGYVWYSGRHPATRKWMARGGELPGPTWLRNLVGPDFLADVDEVSFRDPFSYSGQFDDDDLESVREHLEGMTNLKRLVLYDSQVTDTGAEHLKGLTGIESLELGNTKVTTAGIQKLQRALPNCEIDY